MHKHTFEQALQARELLILAKTAYENSDAALKHCDDEYIDLNHALEFFEHTPETLCRLAGQLRDNRKRRREAKENKERLAAFQTLTESDDNLIEKINKAKNIALFIQTLQEQRRYSIRVRHDLQPEFDKLRGKSLHESKGTCTQA
ncbi:hypothetical protein [Paenibacillus massiliensis]|uniref:hypothetical protein n=1 Tax=Paenibacillus massiliensis TaxID=225917 RepID=UPI000471117D|nr:hypothetical protein [Paenibacillus massiliensis]